MAQECRGRHYGVRADQQILDDLFCPFDTTRGRERAVETPRKPARESHLAGSFGVISIMRCSNPNVQRNVPPIKMRLGESSSSTPIIVPPRNRLRLAWRDFAISSGSAVRHLKAWLYHGQIRSASVFRRLANIGNVGQTAMSP
jgi:hypothetical protein